MEYEQILVTTDGPIARITLARAERRNALSLEMMREILAAGAPCRSTRPSS